MLCGVFIFTNPYDPLFLKTSGKITEYVSLIPFLSSLPLVFIITIVRPVLQLYFSWRYVNSYPPNISSLDGESSFVGETLHLYLHDRNNIAEMERYIFILFAAFLK